MVCTDSIGVQSQMPGLAANAATSDKSALAPPTAAQKELMKLQKKLREIAKIEERLQGGEHVDPLQRLKVEKKEALEASVAQMEREMAAGANPEEEAGSDRSTCAPTPPVCLSPPLQPDAAPAVPPCWGSQGLWAPCAAQRPQQQPQQLPQPVQMLPQMVVFQQAAMPADAAVSHQGGVAPGAQFAPWQFQQVQPMHLLQAGCFDAACAGGYAADAAAAALGFEVPYYAPDYCGASGVAPAPAQLLLQPPQAQLSLDSPRTEASSSQPESGLPSPAGVRAQRPERPKAPGTAAASRSGPPPALGREQCAQLLKDLELAHARATAAAVLPGSALQLALGSEEGCRLVQKALEVADRRTTTQLLKELHGHVHDLIKSPHGNYVVQKVIEVMSPALAHFVVRELRGHADYFARHRYGCRILCRLLEHSDSSGGAESVERAELVDEVLSKAEALCRHTFAHHVTEAVLEHGTEWQRRRVYMALRSDPLRNAQDRYASFVIQAALVNCAPQDAEALATEIIEVCGGHECGVLQLAQTRFGVRLVQSFAKQPCTRQAVLAALQANSNILSQTKHGRHLLEQVGLAAGAAGDTLSQ